MIPITKPSIGEAEARAAAEVIKSGWLAQGPRVAEFERDLAASVGARRAVAVSSGTGALHLALVACGIGAGDEVLLPSLSYIATANAVRYTGATPVFVDVDPRSFNLNPALLERALTPRTRAILPVHQLGLPAELDPILALAQQRGLHVVEDGACALGASYGGRRVGSIGPLCCFSFHPRKVITTGEGGAITTDDEALARRLIALRAHGVSIPAHLRHQADQVTDEEYGELGFNYRLTDVQAAIGVAQLRRLDEILARRRALAQRYTERLGAQEAITPPLVPLAGFEHTFQSYMVLLDERLLRGRPRRQIMQELLDQGIATRRAVMAIHLQPLYAGTARWPLPATEEVARRGLILPLYPQLTEEEQDLVVEHLLAACGLE